MNLVGSAHQGTFTNLLRADVTLSGSAQLVLGRSWSRSFLLLQNLSTHSMFIEFGSARATATLTSGVVTSVAVNNGGFNFTLPPVIEFLGGGGDAAYQGLPQAGGQAPQRPAQAHCNLSGNAVNTITVDDGGALYRVAPYVLIMNAPNDPNGCATPSATSGVTLAAGASLMFNGTACPTVSVAVIGTAADVLFCGWCP